MTCPGQPTPLIEYPCRWNCKLVGRRAQDLAVAAEHCAAAIFGDELDARGLHWVPSRTSARGNYVSLNLTLLLNSEQERHDFLKRLGREPEILMII